MGDDVAAPRTPETRAFEARPGVGEREGRRRLAVAVTSAASALTLWSTDHLGWLDTQPGGPAFFVHVRPLGVVALGVVCVVAVRSAVLGAALASLTVGVVGAFAVRQLVPGSAAVVIAIVGAPTIVGLLVAGRRGRGTPGSDRTIHPSIAAAACVGLAVTGAVVGERVHRYVYGPTHPVSEAAPLPRSAVTWVWSGGVTSTSAEIRTRTSADASATVELVVGGQAGTFVRRVPAVDRGGGVLAFSVGGLIADTVYRYAVEIDGAVDPGGGGVFRTFPTGPSSFSFTVGGCARVGSNGAVFDAIAAEEPLLHVITGDFHYGDIMRNDRVQFDEVIDVTLRQPAQAALYRSTPIAYVWDDHDYGPDDSDAASPSRPAAMEAYRANVPSYPLAGEDSPLHQRFDVGRVRFLVTDARAGRIPGMTMLGAQQLAWFLDELVIAAEEQALVVWVNPVPWIADADRSADHWGGFADERRTIADHIAEHDVDNLVMVSGDAHMVAIDDGTNTDYSSEGDAGFPLLHAAALDRRAEVKGGPYSHGAIGGGGQYGLVEVHDDGTRIRVELSAKRYDGTVLLSHTFDVEG